MPWFDSGLVMIRFKAPIEQHPEPLLARCHEVEPSILVQIDHGKLAIQCDPFTGRSHGVARECELCTIPRIVINCGWITCTGIAAVVRPNAFPSDEFLFAVGIEIGKG